MSIIVQCACGQKLRISPDNAGKRIRCPKCKALVAASPTDAAPAKGPGFVVVEDEEADQDIPAATAAEEEEFDVMEDARDLPEVERVKRPKKKNVGPRRRSLDDQLHDRRDYLFGMDGATLALVMVGVGFLLCCCVSCAGTIIFRQPVIVVPGLCIILVLIIIAYWLAQIKR
jgi:hypothetical protein